MRRVEGGATEGTEQRAESGEQRAEGGGRRAEGEERRAKSKLAPGGKYQRRKSDNVFLSHFLVCRKCPSSPLLALRSPRFQEQPS